MRFFDDQWITRCFDDQRITRWFDDQRITRRFNDHEMVLAYFGGLREVSMDYEMLLTTDVSMDYEMLLAYFGGLREVSMDYEMLCRRMFRWITRCFDNGLRDAFMINGLRDALMITRWFWPILADYGMFRRITRCFDLPSLPNSLSVLPNFGGSA